MWILGYTYTYVVKVLEEERNPIVLFAGDSTFYQAYTFFSVGHAIDLLNLFFLLQPTALVLLFTSGWLKYKQENKTEGKIFLALIMEYADAARCYERGVILEPSTSRFLSPLGRIYTLMGQDAKTIEIYKRMDSLGCADAQIYSKLGILYLKYRCCNDALMYLYKAEALDSSSALIPFHIGTAVAIRENSYEKGLPYFLKAIELDPLYAIAYYNASLCYRKMGDMVMAQNYYKRFDELSSSQPSGTRQDVSDPY
jgi:tetratricopeptide (TPR) repeat protein